MELFKAQRAKAAAPLTTTVPLIPATAKCVFVTLGTESKEPVCMDKTLKHLEALLAFSDRRKAE